MTSPGQSSTTAASGSNQKVLRFTDGSQALGNPDNYLSKGITGRITQSSDLSNEIIEAFVVALATTMTVAATKSAAKTRA